MGRSRGRTRFSLNACSGFPLKSCTAEESKNPSVIMSTFLCLMQSLAVKRPRNSPKYLPGMVVVGVARHKSELPISKGSSYMLRRCMSVLLPDYTERSLILPQELMPLEPADALIAKLCLHDSSRSNGMSMCLTACISRGPGLFLVVCRSMAVY